LIETRFNTLYVCEIKFSKDPIGVSVVILGAACPIDFGFEKSSRLNDRRWVNVVIWTHLRSFNPERFFFAKIDRAGRAEYNEVRTKIEALTHRKKFSIRPILIQVNGVTDAILESEFFARIIDIGQLLQL